MTNPHSALDNPIISTKFLYTDYTSYDLSTILQSYGEHKTIRRGASLTISQNLNKRLSQRVNENPGRPGTLYLKIHQIQPPCLQD